MAGPLIWNGLNAKALTRDILLSNAFFNEIRVGNQFSHNSSTGVESGGVLSINSPPSALFDLSAGSGTFIDYTVPTVPTFKSISWNTFTAQTVTGLATQDETYILINNAGAIIQQSNYPTPAQRRTNIFIGRIGHTSRVTIQFATSFPDFSQSISSSVFDVFDALGPFNISGNETLNNGANLTFQRTAGRMFFRSFNYPSDNYNPHTITTAAVTPAAFNYRQRTGGIIGGPGTVTAVDPASYDSGAGSPTAIPGGPNVSTIQRIYLAPNGVMQIQYGQTLYANITTAAASIGTDTFIQNPALTNVTILVGYLVVRSGATALNNTGDGIFLRAPKFETGVGGGVNTVTSLQQTYNSSVPAVINLDTTSGRIRFYDNAVPIGSLFQVGSSGGGINYLNVDATGIQVTGTIDTSLTASRAVVSGPSKQLQSSATTTAQIGFLSNVTSDIQAQINTKQGTNLILDPSFESGTVSQWSLGTTGTLTNGIPTGTPTFGSGASGNLSISAQTTGALLGTYSLQYQHVTNQTVAGNMMATNAITIQPEFQGKVMGVKFAYQTTANPTNGNYSGTSANSFGWALFDVTNNAYIGTAGQFNIVQNSGVGICTGTAQLPINTTSIRFVFYNVTATSATTGGGAITMLLDDFFLGPQVTSVGPAMSDAVAWTPVFDGLGTIANVSAYWSRRGDKLIGQVAVATGTHTATLAAFTLPSGLSPDFTKMGTNTVVGKLSSSKTPFSGGLAMYTSAPTKVHFTADTLDYANVAAPGTTWASTNQFGFTFEVPITGWSSNTVQSADTDTRVVAMQVQQASPTATITSSMSLVKFTSGVIADTAGSYSTSTGGYTASVSGFYKAVFGLQINATYSASNFAAVGIGKNSTTTASFAAEQLAGGASGALAPVVSATIFCNAGDVLYPMAQTNGTTPTVGATSILNYFTVERLSGPAVVQASDTVACSYTGTASAPSAGYATVVYSTKVYDSHNAYNNSTGVFTAPISGKYRVNASLLMGGTFALNTINNVAVAYNGATYREAGNRTGGAVSDSLPALNATIAMNAGDTLTFQGRNQAVSPTYTNLVNYTYMSIERVGN